MLLRKLIGGLLREAPQPSAVPAPLVLVLMRSSIGRHLETFCEVMELVAAGFADIGYETVTMINEFAEGRDHIVFCPHLLRAEDVERVPPSTILYNFEPLNPPVFDSVGIFLSHYAPRFRVWDYSAANVEYLKGRGCSAQHVPLGYAPVLSRIAPAARQDIDVLFYGDLSARRVRVLDGLRASGLNVVVLSDTYGAERDAVIARSRVVVNIHNHEGIKGLETPRVFYLLANRKAVVTEVKSDVEIEDDLRRAMIGVPYDELVAACIALVGDPERRAVLEDAGFECMKSRRQSAILATAMGVAKPR